MLLQFLVALLDVLSRTFASSGLRIHDIRARTIKAELRTPAVTVIGLLALFINHN